MIALALLLATVLPGPACRLINSDRIYGRDMAAAVPAFASLSPDSELGFAPVPGQKRLFRTGELRRIAKARGIEAEINEDVCFAWDLAVPEQQDIVAAMKKSLDGRTATLTIVDHSSQPAPRGELDFPLSGISGVSEAAVVWKGYVRYGRDKHFPIWARVRIAVRQQRVVAAEPLAIGVPIRAEQLRVETHEGPVSPDKTFQHIDEVIGLLPRFPLSSGSALTANLLEHGKDVQRGDLVEVTVEAGGARIEAQGIAQDSGARGAVISVKNTRSGKSFRARIEGKDKVLVVPLGFSALVTEEKKS